ncbi:MAG: OsmC family protein [Nitrospinae bacterium]|nr:OsmC family protein [Nitrospinota bacterium]
MSDQNTITRVANAQWMGDLRARIQARDCPEFSSDEPVERGGLFEHPTPAEYMLGALTGCGAAHVELFANEVGMTIDDCAIEGRLTMERFSPGDPHAENGGVTGVELDIEVTSAGSAEELDEVKEKFRAGCILYLFMSTATRVNDNWTLKRPG